MSLGGLPRQHAVFLASAILTTFACAAHARADDFTLWAATVPDVNGWNYTSRCVGAVGGACNDTFDSCRNRLNTTCSAEAPVGAAANTLWATQFTTFTRPAGHAIRNVWVDVFGSWLNFVDEAAVEIRVRGPVTTFVGAGGESGCRWLLAASGANGLEITPLLSRAWTQADVNNLEVGVARETSTYPPSTVFLTGYRIRVSTSCELVTFAFPPQNQALCEGSAFSLSSALLAPDGASIQWLRDGQAIPGATSTSFTLPAVQPADQGLYAFRATSACGTQISNAIQLTVLRRTELRRLDDMRTCNGGTAVFSVATPSGEGPFTFRWRKNATFLSDGPGTAGGRGLTSGSSTAELTIASTSTGDTGLFDCVVAGRCSDATSNSAHLSICSADLDNGSGTGTCDGGVTIEDLLYFLAQFARGTPRADLDNGSGTGVPDGGVTIEDLLYFLDRFGLGC